jgi:hypothetical protein
VNLGYRRKIDDRFALQLTAQDVFLQNYSQDASEGATFHEAGWRKNHDRVAFASLIWNFGRGPKKEPDFEYGGGGSGPR